MTLKTELEFRIKLATNKLASLWRNNQFQFSSENNTQNIFINLKTLYAIINSNELFYSETNNNIINNILNYYKQFITYKDDTAFLLIDNISNNNWNSVFLLICKKLQLADKILFQNAIVNSINNNHIYTDPITKKNYIYDFYPIYALLLNDFYDKNLFNEMKKTNLYNFYESFCIYKYENNINKEIENFKSLEIKSTTSLFTSQYQRTLLLNGFSNDNLKILDYQLGTQITQGENAGLFEKRKNSKQFRLDYTSESIHSMIEIYNTI
jgi:hypothetical protein